MYLSAEINASRARHRTGWMWWSTTADRLAISSSGLSDVQRPTRYLREAVIDHIADLLQYNFGCRILRTNKRLHAVSEVLSRQRRLDENLAFSIENCLAIET